MLRRASEAGDYLIELSVVANAVGSQARLVARLDNLGKGASGACVQNLNILAGRPETAGLRPSNSKTDHFGFTRSCRAHGPLRLKQPCDPAKAGANHLTALMSPDGTLHRRGTGHGIPGRAGGCHDRDDD